MRQIAPDLPSCLINGIPTLHVFRTHTLGFVKHDFPYVLSSVFAVGIVSYEVKKTWNKAFPAGPKPGFSAGKNRPALSFVVTEML